MANSAFTPAVLTVSGSSSTSSGEKNYVTATDGNASGLWVASGVTVATSTSTIPDNITKASSLAIAWVSGTTGYARYRFTLDQADYGKKFKIQWDQVYGTAGHWTLQVWSNTASDYTGTSTQLTVQTSAVPGITGTFTTSVDMPGSTAPYIEIRIVASSTSATTIYLNSILMGPGTITQGAVISEWVEFTPTLKGSTSDPSLGTTGQAQYGRYIRIGSNAKIRYNWRFGTTSPSFGSGTYYFLMPTGLTVDTSRLETSSNNNANPIIGHGYVADDSANINYLTEVLWDRANDRLTMLAGSNGVAVTQIAPMTFAAQDSIIIEIEVPIAEWAGSGTVNLGAGAQVEWAYNTSTSATVSDTTSFGYGPSGNTFGSITSALQRRVRFQYPIQNDDLITVEASEDRVKWFTVSGFCFNNSSTDRLMEYAVYNGKTYGVGSIALVNSTDVDVAFGAYAVIDTASATYGANGTAWSLAWGARYWRVRKAKASSPVGFGKADSTSFGLVAPRRGPLVVTSANQATYFSSLPSGFSMTRGVFIYYQDQDLNHRLKFNLVGSMTSATSASFTWASTAVVYKSGVEQAVTAWSGTSGSWSTGRVTGSVMNYYVSAASTYVSLSGDVELDSKPTWA